MKVSKVARVAPSESERRLKGFVDKFDPRHQKLIRAVRKVAGSNGIGLCFIRGESLFDPKIILLGSGKQTRFIRLESASVLARPGIEALLAAAIAQAKTPLRKTGRGMLIIRSVSAKQRPRHKSANNGRGP